MFLTPLRPTAILLLFLFILLYTSADLSQTRFDWKVENTGFGYTTKTTVLQTFANPIHVFAGQRLVVEITRPNLTHLPKSLPYYTDFNIVCSPLLVTSRSGSSPSTAPGASINPINVTIEPEKITLTFYTAASDGDFGGWSFDFHSQIPLYMILGLDVAFTYPKNGSPEWQFASRYHLAGINPSTGTITPPISLELIPDEPNKIKFTIYDIANGVFDLSKTALVFLQIPNTLSHSNPQLLPIGSNPSQIPPNASVHLEYVPQDDALWLQARDWLTFDGIPLEFDEVSFTIQYSQTVSTLSDIYIGAFLRSQRLENHQGALNRELFRPFSITNLPFFNSNALISVAPDGSWASRNGLVFTFSIKVPPVTDFNVMLPISSLTGTIRILRCQSEPYWLYDPQFLPSNHVSRGSFLISIRNTATPITTTFQFSCFAYASGLIKQFDRDVVLKEHLFEIQSGILPSAPIHSSLPQSLQTRTTRFDEILGALTPITATVARGHYLSKKHTFTNIDGEEITMIGTKRTITVDFPGLFSNQGLSITIPSYFHIRSDIFFKREDQYLVNFQSWTSTTQPSYSNDVTAYPSFSNTYSNLVLNRFVNEDGTITWNFNSGAVFDKGLNWKEIDFYEFNFSFEIYRPMSIEIDSVYSKLISKLYFIDGDKNPIDPNLDNNLDITISQNIPTGLPQPTQFDQIRNFRLSVPSSPLAFQTPPNIFVPCIRNVLPTLGSYNTEFTLYFGSMGANNDNSDKLNTFSPFSEEIQVYVGDKFRLYITDSWSSPFSLTTPSSSPPGLPFSLSLSQNILTMNVISDFSFNSTALPLILPVHWSTPLPIPTKLPISIEFYPKDAYEALITLTVQPTFVRPVSPNVASHSLIPKITTLTDSSKVYSSTIPMDWNVDHNNCNIHDINTKLSEFILNKNQQVDLQIVFGSQIEYYHVPSIYYIKAYHYQSVNGKPAAPVELVSETTYSHPQNFSLPPDKTVTIPFNTLTLPALTEFIYIEISYRFLQPNTIFLPYDYLHYVASPLFTATSPCLSPTNINYFIDTTQIGNWQPSCGDKGHCGAFGCICDDNFSGASCGTPLDPCRSNNCVPENTTSCSEDAKCICTSGWFGDRCQMPQNCFEKSIKKCSFPQGFLPPTDQNNCRDTCQCNSSWVGPKCETCFLKCWNNGIPYKTCDKCGCPAGFAGKYCQCYNTIARVTIEAYNTAHQEYMAILLDENGQKVTPQTTFSSLVKLTRYNTLLNQLTAYLVKEMGFSPQTEVELNLGEMMSEKIQSDGSPLNLSLGISSSQSNGDISTTLSASIIFGCGGHNRSDDLNTIQQKWSSVVEKLLLSDEIMDNFEFRDFNSDIKSDFVNGDESLPPEGERLDQNQATGFGLLMVISISALFVFFV
jgi:hypothetical protein